MITLTQSQIMQNWGVDNAENPLVSVRCITYNHEPYIAQALDGFLMQKTNFPFEVIVHDDASTDKTAEIIREYEKKFPKIIKPIYEKENQYSKHDGSLGRIVNSALKGKYVAMCEGDDYWIDENKLQMQVDFLEGNPEYGMCFSNAKIVDKANLTSILIPGIKKNRRITTQEIIKNGGMFVPTPSMIFKREIWKNYPDVCSQCWVGDYPLQIYNALKWNIYFFSIPLAAYRKNAMGSWSERSAKKTFWDKRKGIESELIMLNGLNSLSNYKFNSAFMIRKFTFLEKYVFCEKKLVIDGHFYNVVYYLCLIPIYIKKCLCKLLNITRV